jgi:hypothetical protein
MKKWFIILVVFLLCRQAGAQWELGMGVGIPFPITSYAKVVKPGWLPMVFGKYRFGNGSFATGMEIHLARLQRDRDPTDAFGNTRMTLAPVIFTAEYEAFMKNRLRPYIKGGLGLALFTIDYDEGASAHRSIFNLSFTMSPEIGLRYAASSHFQTFIGSNLVLLADGPPVGFPQGNKITGYASIIAGTSYRF